MAREARRRDQRGERAPALLCPRCGADLVLRIDPASPPDAEAVALSADPPYRFVCLECDDGR